MGLNLLSPEFLDRKKVSGRLSGVAEIISSIFDPLVLALVSLLLILQKTSEISSPIEFVSWFLLVVVIGIAPPVGFLIYRIRSGKIQDWFITNRVERKAISLVTLVSALTLVVIISLLQGPRLLLAFSLVSFFISLLISLITLYWKVSVHTNSITTFTLILIFLYGPVYSFSLLLVPLVGWARWELGKHTFSQVTGGIFISIGVFLVVFRLFNYL
jgi:membrane-associated phospholipid phosphatase